MKKIILPFFVLACLSSTAQLKGVLKDKVGEKLKGKTTTTENTSGNTNSTTNGNTTDANAGSQGTQNNTNTTNGGNQGFPGFNMGGKKEIRPTYTFKSNVLMEMRSYDKKGNLESDKVAQMRWQISDEPYTGIEMIDKKENKKIAFSISEADKEQMVTLMENDGQKIAMVRKVDAASSSQNSSSEKKPTVTKTGRTKTLLGYNCEEWTSVNEKGEKTEMWVTNEVAIDLSKTMGMYAKNDKKMGAQMGSSEYPQGFMMEMTHYDTNGEKFMMVTLEVNANAAKTIETAGYVIY
ncbi:MAG TPA: DUF4412 domain-containing protein [Flavobacteriales bacterium]|nr:DUF4412 domain-containing protein [Flavobacteriales bacterium]